MKNIYLIPTDKPTRLFTSDSELILAGYPATTFRTGKSLYITSDEEIEEGDWFYDLDTKYTKIKQSFENSHLDFNAKKIILTTDVDLIKDDVQALDNEFLEWFVKNPSSEEAKVEITEISCIIPNFGDVDKYRIAIPNAIAEQIRNEEKDIEQPALTSDEVRKEYIKGFNEGSDWQQEQDKKLYSIEDMLLAFETGRNFQLTGENNFKELIEHLKNRI